MDKKFIKVLIEEGKPICEMSADAALTLLNNEIMTVYVMNGLHRSMQPEAFREEVRTGAVAMFKEFTTDKLYKTVRDKELSYIFSNGMKGRLGTDKDIVLTCKSLLRWVEGYIKHPERKEALNQFVDEKMEPPKQLPHHEPTDDDLKRKVSEAWADYCEYRNKMEKQEKFGRVKSLGEAISVPITCLDYGGMRIDYLKRNGYASDGEKLLDVFKRAYEGVGLEKVVSNG